jgi:hypothetical protein
MAALRKFISLPEAAKKIHASVDDLRPLIEKGKIKAATINGEIFVDTLTLPNKIMKKEDMPEYKIFWRLAGSEISIGEAARKYQIPRKNISIWKKKGIITQTSVVGQKTFVNEQDVAYCARIYKTQKEKKQTGELKGQWLFGNYGIPYVKENEKAPRKREVVAT